MLRHILKLGCLLLRGGKEEEEQNLGKKNLTCIKCVSVCMFSLLMLRIKPSASNNARHACCH